jgi:hypothetical protein
MLSFVKLKKRTIYKNNNLSAQVKIYDSASEFWKIGSKDVDDTRDGITFYKAHRRTPRQHLHVRKFGFPVSVPKKST